MLCFPISSLKKPMVLTLPDSRDLGPKTGRSSKAKIVLREPPFPTPAMAYEAAERAQWYISIYIIYLYIVYINIYIYLSLGWMFTWHFLWSCCNNSLLFYGSFWWFMVIYGYVHGDLWFCILYDYLYDDLYDHVDDYWFMVIYIIIDMFMFNRYLLRLMALSGHVWFFTDMYIWLSIAIIHCVPLYITLLHSGNYNCGSWTIDQKHDQTLEFKQQNVEWILCWLTIRIILWL